MKLDKYGHEIADTNHGVCRECHIIDKMRQHPDEQSKRTFLASQPIAILRKLWQNNPLSVEEQKLVIEAHHLAVQAVKQQLAPSKNGGKMS